MRLYALNIPQCLRLALHEQKGGNRGRISIPLAEYMIPVIGIVCNFAGVICSVHIMHICINASRSSMIACVCRVATSPEYFWGSNSLRWPLKQIFTEMCYIPLESWELCAFNELLHKSLWWHLGYMTLANPHTVRENQLYAGIRENSRVLACERGVRCENRPQRSKSRMRERESRIFLARHP